MRTGLRLFILISMLCAVPARGVLAQQALEGFSYDNLRFNGVQVETGVITSSRLKGAAQVALRV
ncbi:MAG TPA: hypothetical protein VK845_02840, partial [Gemmatimonadales bacterium]|nr:hypothetical protein [Gemmatimonadales bacterium]